MELKYREADLAQCPVVLEHDSKHISIGDLHGNVLKLIYILIEEGVLKLDKEDYNTLYRIYKTPVELLDPENLNLFRTIIDRAQITTKKALTLIGDELADRGNNDYFTLLVLKKLHESHLNMDILLSNHSAEFIRDYEQKSFTGVYNLRSGQGQSLANMHQLIAKGLVNEEEVRDIIKQSYVPFVKGISYTLSLEGELTLYSHAPIGLETISALAKEFKIPYQDQSLKDLVHTIDNINKKIQLLFTDKQVSPLTDKGYTANPDYPLPLDFPLRRLVWNRVVSDELITRTVTGLNIGFVHGHIGDGPTLKNGKELCSHQNLDTSWGKFPKAFKTGYNSTWKVNIKHCTGHSNDYTALELNDSVWNDLSYKITYKQFNILLAEIKLKTDELIVKGTKGHPKYDPNYEKIKTSAEELYQSLYDAGELFSNKKITKDSFIQTVEKAVAKANTEFSHHRNPWHELHPLLKKILGVLSFLLFGIPALIVNEHAKHGFSATFFGNPPTDSSEKLHGFQQKFNRVVQQSTLVQKKDNEAESDSDAKPQTRM